jgi:hypothetical protein
MTPPVATIETPQGAAQPAPAEKPKEKKGFFGKLKDIFK